jgi:VanZ family protein
VKTLRAVLIFWVPLIAWFLVIHNLSAIPSDELPQIDIPFADKVFHAVEYFILGILLMRAFDKSCFKVGLAKSAFLAIIISLCYGALDELYQRSVPGRACDMFDFAADAAGALAGILIYMMDTKERRG